MFNEVITLTLAAMSLAPGTCSDTKFKFKKPIDVYATSVYPGVSYTLNSEVFMAFAVDKNNGIFRICNTDTKKSITKKRKVYIYTIPYEARDTCSQSHTFKIWNCLVDHTKGRQFKTLDEQYPTPPGSKP